MPGRFSPQQNLLMRTAGNTVPVTDPPCRQVVCRWDMGVVVRWYSGVCAYGWIRWLRFAADACRERTPAIAAAAMVPAVGAAMKTMAARLSQVLSAPRLNPVSPAAVMAMTWPSPGRLTAIRYQLAAASPGR